MSDVVAHEARKLETPGFSGLEYSATVTSRDHAGRPFHCYDAGDFTPYCIEGLLALLADEIGSSRELPSLTLELFGPCEPRFLETICGQFQPAAEIGARIEIRSCCGIRRLPAAAG